MPRVAKKSKSLKRTAKRSGNTWQLMEDGDVVAEGAFSESQVAAWRNGKLGEGNCYEIAAKLVTGEEGRQLEMVELCHATVTGQGPIDGCKFGHAWLEHTVRIPNSDAQIRMVLDKSNGRDVSLPADFYYRLGNISEVQRYSISETRAKLVLTGNYGPW